MKILLSTFIYMTIFFFSATGQVLFKRNYGFIYSDFLGTAFQTNDNGYFLVGTTITGTGLFDQDILAVKTNELGDTLWTKKIGGIEPENGADAIKTNDGGVIIVGNTESFGNGSWDVYLVKMNSIGIIEWTKTYGGVSQDHGNSIIQTDDGGYAIVGSTISTTSNYDIFLIKTNNIGDTLWTKSIGGLDNDVGNSILQTIDGGYILAGTTSSFGAGSDDMYLLKLNSNGDTIWTSTFGGLDYEFAKKVIQTSDGGYALVGGTGSYGLGAGDNYLVKSDPNGNMSWSKNFGGTSTLQEAASSLIQTSDGGLLITGNLSVGAGNYNLYIIKTNSMGDSLWTKNYGGLGSDNGVSIGLTLDGGFVFGGNTSSFGSLSQFYLLKTDSLCNIAPQGVAEQLALSGFTVQPNPSNEITNFQFPKCNSIGFFSIFNLDGQSLMMEEIEIGSIQKSVNISNWEEGVYLACLIVDDQISRIKFTVMR